MATPPAPGGQGFGSFPQQQPQQPPQQQAPNGAHGFGPPPGLPASPGLPAQPGPAAATVGTSAVGGPGGPGGPGAKPGGKLLRNTVWAFVGALLASAAWGTAVLTVPGIVTSDTAPLGIRGYRVVDDLCATAKLTQFSKIYTTPDDTPYHNTTRHKALDSMYCSLQMKRGGTGSSSSDYGSIYVRAELHKAVNPSAEFTAAKSGLEQQRYQITDVPDIGDEAYLAYRDEPSKSDKTWHNLSYELEVRDGGLTYYLSWSDSYQEGKNTSPGREEIRKALLADSRDLLSALGGKV